MRAPIGALRLRGVKTIVVSAVMAAGLATAQGAFAAGGVPGSLCANPVLCAGTTSLSAHNPTHYKLPVGTHGTFKIVGATDVAAGSVTVYVKSSTLGNTAIAATAEPDPVYGMTIAFSYTAPANGCDTSVVSYATPGNVSNNDIVDNGARDGSAAAAAGFAFTNAKGDVIACGSASSSTIRPTGHALTGSATGAASYDRIFGWTITKSVDRSSARVGGNGTAPFAYTVTVTHDAGSDSGWSVAGTITATNPNADAVPGVSVTANVADPAAACSVAGGSGVTIPGGSSISLPYTCVYSSAPAAAAEAVETSVSWPAGALATVDLAAGGVSASAPVSWAVPTRLIDASATVADSAAGLLGTVSSSDPGVTTFTYTRELGSTPGTCETHPNTATLSTSTTTTSDSRSVTVCAGADAAVTATATPSFTRTYAWSIAKSASTERATVPAGTPANVVYGVDVSATSADSGWILAGTAAIANPNDWEPMTVALAIDAGGGASCALAGPAAVTLAPGESQTVAYTCTYAAAPAPAAGNATVTATWDAAAASTPSASATGSAAYDFGAVAPSLVDGSASVGDSMQGDLGTVSAADLPAHLSYTRSLDGSPGTCTDYDNTATLTTSTTGSTASASRSVTVCVGVDATVAATASPSFTRTYGWSVDKSVDRTLAQQAGGGTASFAYTVSAQQTGFADSGWAVHGTIQVSNPNDWEQLTVNVADAVDNGGACTVAGGGTVVVPAGGMQAVSYACTYGSAPAPLAGIDAAAVTWDAVAAATPSGSAQASQAFDFATTTPDGVNRTVTVTDAFDGGAAATLGTLTATDVEPFAAATFSYARSAAVPAWNCVSYGNVARIAETGQSNAVTVRTCGPARTGALTIGYWQNKNGQAVLTGGASTGGICNAATWLRTLAPFADLSSTATCSATATWVTSVIKAANASGASMNAMLKAQMLATALDVYFSTPGLGGNKIAAPVAIGGVAIDVRAWAGGFGSARSLTVLQMLQYASGQSSAGGSSWYANVKATQGFAKDAFDAVNNAAAFPA